MYESVKADFMEAKTQYYKRKTRNSREHLLLAIGRYQGIVFAGVTTAEQSNDYFAHRGEIDAILNERL